VLLAFGTAGVLTACIPPAAAGTVPGRTAASPPLQHDILNILAACERALAPGCPLRVTDTRALPGATLADYGERWTLDRCGARVDYDITMRRAADGGTDFSLTCRP
jgi:hypothetical protein